jgi:hypothetical protein
VHFHVHSPKIDHSSPHSHVHTHAPFAVGTLHGLAGSSHLAGILPALAFPSNAQAFSYLVAYCIATIIAMTSFSVVVRFVARGFALSGLATYRVLMSGCALAAFSIGTYWLVM